MPQKLAPYNKFIAAIAGAVLLWAQQKYGVEFGVDADSVPAWAIGAAAALGVAYVTNAPLNKGK